MAERLLKASWTLAIIVWISATVFADCFDNSLTSAATTANPFPYSPALVDSIAAFSDSKLVCDAISDIISDRVIASYENTNYL